jgi:hypothetical protein
MFLCPLVINAADKPEPLNVKTGTWDMTITTVASGQIPMPEEQLAQLPPATRARLEQMFKEKMNAPQTRTYRQCIREEDLKRWTFADKSKDCTRTVLSSSSTRQDIREECTSQDGKNVTTFHLQASSPENVTGKVELQMSAGARTMNVNGTVTGKWLGTACDDDK